MDTLRDLLGALPSLETPHHDSTQGPKSSDARPNDSDLSLESPTFKSEEESSQTSSADTWEEHLPEEGTPSFSYLYQRLVTQQEPLVLLGESPSRALSVAFAVMRGSLKNIWATRLKVEQVFWDATNFAERIKDSKWRGKCNSNYLTQYWDFNYNADTDYEHFIDHCQDTAADEMDFLTNFSMQADARNLRVFFSSSGLRHLGHKNILFQCPWAGQLSTGRLLQETVTSAAEIQGPGDLLLFGLIDTRLKAHSDLTPHRREIYTKYRNIYHVPELKSCAIRHGYRSLAEDKDLIKYCLRFGYRHCSDGPADLHQRMLRYKELVIYVFVKISSPEDSCK